MRVLFDHGTPRGLARALTGHEVVRAQDMGGDRLSNGDLLTAAEQTGFEVLLTTDQNIRYQQNFTGRKIAMVVLTGTTRWTRVRLHFGPIAAAVSTATTGSYTEVVITSG